jgi:hypothetical protein
MITVKSRCLTELTLTIKTKDSESYLYILEIALCPV